VTTDEAQLAQFVARIRAERAAMGRPPTIQCPAGYRILAAVLASHAEDERTERRNMRAQT
jgi:hypothetical protein